MTTPKPTPNNLAFLTIPVQDWGAFFVEDVTLVGCVCLCVCVCMCVCVCVCACQMKVMVGDSGLCCCVPCHAQWCQLSDSDADSTGVSQVLFMFHITLPVLQSFILLVFFRCMLGYGNTVHIWLKVKYGMNFVWTHLVPVVWCWVDTA